MDRKSAAFRVIATSSKALVVLGIVVTFGGVIFLQVVGYRNRIDSMPREAHEIAELTYALEMYRSYYGEYPRNVDTDLLAPNFVDDPAAYIPAAVFLYDSLAAPASPNRTGAGPRVQFIMLTPNRVRTDNNGRQYVIDPWGNPYGYSTIKAAHPNSRGGNNSAFDLWSTGGGTTGKARSKWIKNW